MLELKEKEYSYLKNKGLDKDRKEINDWSFFVTYLKLKNSNSLKYACDKGKGASKSTLKEMPYI